MSAAKPTSKIETSTLKPIDKRIYGVVKDAYIASFLTIQRRVRLQKGHLWAAIKRLKQAGWIVDVPSLGGYMTKTNYYRRLNGEDLDNDTDNPL